MGSAYLLLVLPGDETMTLVIWRVRGLLLLLYYFNLNLRYFFGWSSATAAVSEAVSENRTQIHWWLAKRALSWWGVKAAAEEGPGGRLRRRSSLSRGRVFTSSKNNNFALQSRQSRSSCRAGAPERLWEQTGRTSSKLQHWLSEEISQKTAL